VRAALALLLVAAGCSRAPELSLDIRLPSDRHLLAAVSTLNLVATRGTQVLAQASFAGTASSVSLSGVAHGTNTVITLDGVTSAGDVIARGRTCPIDFLQSGTTAPLYFAPTNSFAPTVGAPAATRADPIVVPLSDGTVLLAGGAGDSGPTDSVELFAPGSATFAPAPMTLNVARQEAEAVLVPNVGVLVTGGLDAGGVPVARAEVFDEAQRLFLSLPDDQRLDARFGHRAVLTNGNTVLISGGQSQTVKALASTVFVKVLAGGAASISAGPSLSTARYQHAAVVGAGTPVIIGGYGIDGVPLASIEALDATVPAFAPIASLRFARAEATASLLDDGSILVVGGAGDQAGTPRADAELYNPYTQKTTVLELSGPRRGHTATVLPDGRVLIAGGIGVDAQGNAVPLSSVELFSPATGDFVSERPLAAPRAHHVAVPLCDGTVLVVGGRPDAEIYTPPAG
jgi:hypothetical protein